MTNVLPHTALLSRFQDLFEALDKNLNGEKSKPLHRQRKSAFAMLSEIGFPHSKNEEYKYTRISRSLHDALGDLQGIQKPPEVPEINPSEHLPPGLRANLVVFYNGMYVSGLTEIIDNSEEIEINSEPLIESDLSPSGIRLDSFNLLNNSFSQSGVTIRVARNGVIKHPIVILYLQEGESGLINPPRNHFWCAENAQASFIEFFQSKSDFRGFLNSFTRFDLAAGANVKHLRIGSDNTKNLRVSNHLVNQGKDSVFTTVNIDLGGKLVRNNLEINLNDAHCETNLYGLYVLKESSHVDNHTTVDHKKPDSVSNELYKGIMGDQSTAVFNGKIYVRPGAQNTNAFQQNGNILLSEGATVNTKPQLEIWADDVKCSHGCTTGQIDEEQLFYLRARGIDENDARAILLHAFANEILNQVDNKVMKEFIDERIFNHLGM